MYEYGSRAGFWRLWRLFKTRGLPVTVFGVATALARNPEAVAAMREVDWEIASHGLKWIDYKDIGEAEERQHMAEAIRIHKKATGMRPLGWYTGRNSVNTLKAVLDDGGFVYSSDSYADDLPYWVKGPNGPHVVIPYTLDNNDMRFINPQGFGNGDQFFAYLRDAFEVLYEEGEEKPKMMSVGLHCRLTGRPGRAAGLIHFLDHIASCERVWVATRLDIARHWQSVHGALADTAPVGGMSAVTLDQLNASEPHQFVAALGAIYEHSPWVVEAVAAKRPFASLAALHDAMSAVVRTAGDESKRALLNAHPDLAGKAARADVLTADSKDEQHSAGLDRLTDDEFDEFHRLNTAYHTRFGFPFIICVRRHGKDFDLLPVRKAPA